MFMKKPAENQRTTQQGAECQETAEGQDKPNTEELILKAAEREFFSKGYEGARTTAIAAKTGVTHAMLHYYFRTKENLFERVMADKVTVLREILTGFFRDDDVDLFYRLRLGIDRHFDLVAANPELPMFVLREAQRDSGILRRMVEAEFGRLPEMLCNLQRQIDQGARQGENAPVDALMLIVDIVSLDLFAVMSVPLVTTVLGPDVNVDDYLKMRKEEIITTIMKRLKP